MFEFIIICILGIFYVTPFKGIIKLTESEEEFITAYNGFSIITPIEDSEAGDLVGGNEETNVEDVPTTINFGENNSNSNSNGQSDFSDIDISSMGR